MIYQNFQKSNSFSKICIKKYEETQNFKITNCPSCNSDKLIKWGTYTRNIIYFKNNKKQEYTIEIKRIMCNSCNKTHSIIPNFLVPYKIHITEYITEVIKVKITSRKSYEIIGEKYELSRQTIKLIMSI